MVITEGQMEEKNEICCDCALSLSREVGEVIRGRERREKEVVEVEKIMKVRERELEKERRL